MYLFIQEHGTVLPCLSREQIIGATIKEFDNLLNGNVSHEEFLKLYYKYWLHRSVITELGKQIVCTECFVLT